MLKTLEMAPSSDTKGYNKHIMESKTFISKLRFKTIIEDAITLQTKYQ